MAALNLICGGPCLGIALAAWFLDRDGWAALLAGAVGASNLFVGLVLFL